MKPITYILSFTAIATIVFFLIMLWMGDYKDDRKGLLQYTALMIIFGLVISSILVFERTSKTDEWNDGVCPDCQVSWELFDIEVCGGESIYYYQCPNCKSIIEL